jgi:superfamily II DNA or RNA helicase
MRNLASVLEQQKTIFILPRDDIANDVICPAFETSQNVAIMMGFFSSAAFSEIAPGLAHYLRNSKETLRLLVSPYISKRDQEALRAGTITSEFIGQNLFEELIPNADELANHTLSCLAWLIADNRLEMKIAVMRDALFHPKVWLFEDGADCAVLHGSANLTGHGLTKNREQLRLERNWRSDECAEVYVTLANEFDTLWNGGDADCITVPISEALRERIVKDFKGETQPDESEFSGLWRKAHGLDEEPLDVSALLKSERKRSFEIPDWLEYRSGEYAHQGEAVDSWRDAGYRGVLEMCTGSGKTLTAMIGAYNLYQEEKSLLIVICAPYNVLISQWCLEIELFGIKAVNMSQCSGPGQRSREISSARRRLRKGISKVEALVVSNSTLCTAEFVEEIARYPGPKLLIADECHNLGAEIFISNPPDCFDYRLGLSATPIRQYDDEGTAALFGYFGEPCFSYTLEQAIGQCLTPYDYHVEFVELQDDEMDDWREISSKISELSWKIGAGFKDEYLENLFLQRRKILETASSKITALASLIDQADSRSLKYTLIYATDKDPEQLTEVNALLGQRRIKYHQLTAEETAKPKKASEILDRFQSGALQVLTAKRVLDEGVNVPEIMTAYLLASTTVKRQWVQRRGRLLRTCREIGKESATIFDLVALPPGLTSGGELDKDAKKIVESELDRVWEFARLSRNGAEAGGPFEAVEKMRAFVGG